MYTKTAVINRWFHLRTKRYQLYFGISNLLEDLRICNLNLIKQRTYCGDGGAKGRGPPLYISDCAARGDNAAADVLKVLPYAPRGNEYVSAGGPIDDTVDVTSVLVL